MSIATKCNGYCKKCSLRRCDLLVRIAPLKDAVSEEVDGQRVFSPLDSHATSCTARAIIAAIGPPAARPGIVAPQSPFRRARGGGRHVLVIYPDTRTNSFRCTHRHPSPRA